MKTFHKFPSIGKFSDLIRHVHSNCKYHGNEVPTLTIRGTVKLHGTNAAICADAENVWLQTRERILPDVESHMGFREFYVRNQGLLHTVVTQVQDLVGDPNVQIYGEWCGGNVQKGVGLIHLPKMFVIFAVAYGIPTEHGERSWVDLNAVNSTIDETIAESRELYTANMFQTYVMDVDFNAPALVQNRLIELTIDVEDDCPVARALLGPDAPGPLVGEGIVWTASAPNIGTHRFKVKGEKHSASKVRVLAPVDEELVKGISEFVDYAVTENRLEQGIAKLREMGLDPMERKSIGEYVKWVVGDVLREEMAVLANSGIESKAVTGQVSRRASDYIRKWQESGETAMQELAALDELC